MRCCKQISPFLAGLYGASSATWKTTYAKRWAWLVHDCLSRQGAPDDSDENDAYCRAAGLLLSATQNTSESYNRLFELAKQLKNEVPS